MTPEPFAVRLRPIRPDDLPELRSGLRRLSPDTRFQRFHAAVDDLSAAQWRYLTEVDGHDHVALVACTAVPLAGLPEGSIVGVARFIRAKDDPTNAEIAFLVHDRVQGRGIGRTLRDALVVEGRARGIATFRAHVLPSNVAMRRLLHDGALELLGEHDGAFDVALAPRLRRAG